MLKKPLRSAGNGGTGAAAAVLIAWTYFRYASAERRLRHGDAVMHRRLQRRELAETPARGRENYLLKLVELLSQTRKIESREILGRGRGSIGGVGKVALRRGVGNEQRVAAAGCHCQERLDKVALEEEKAWR